VKSSALPPFWKCYNQLPEHIRKLADKNFALFCENPRHPSLGFKRKGQVYTAEIGRHYRAVAREQVTYPGRRIAVLLDKQIRFSRIYQSILYMPVVLSLAVVGFIAQLVYSQDYGVLNALLDLKTVFFLSSPFAPSVPTDAVNMANATGIPALVWAVIWIAIAVGILGLAMRLYVVGRKKQFQLDQPFDQIPVPLFPTTISESQNPR